jgi:hypothetical protein
MERALLHGWPTSNQRLNFNSCTNRQKGRCLAQSAFVCHNRRLVLSTAACGSGSEAAQCSNSIAEPRRRRRSRTHTFEGGKTVSRHAAAIEAQGHDKLLEPSLAITNQSPSQRTLLPAQQQSTQMIPGLQQQKQQKQQKQLSPHLQLKAQPQAAEQPQLLADEVHFSTSSAVVSPGQVSLDNSYTSDNQKPSAASSSFYSSSIDTVCPAVYPETCRAECESESGLIYGATVR